MDNCIPPILPSTPPPFDETQLEDDDQFGDFSRPSVLDFSDPDSLQSTPVHDLKLGQKFDGDHDVEYFSFPPSDSKINLVNGTSDPPLHIVNGFTMQHDVTISESCKESSLEVITISSTAQPPPYEGSSDDGFDDFQLEIPKMSPELGSNDFIQHQGLSISATSLSTVQVISHASEAITVNTASALTEYDSVAVVTKELEDITLGDSDKESACTYTEFPDQPVISIEDGKTPSLTDLSKLCDNGFKPGLGEVQSKAIEAVDDDDDGFTDFDSYFDTRPQTGVSSNISADMHVAMPTENSSSSDDFGDFGDFAAFDSFSQNSQFENFAVTDNTVEDDFGDFVEVSSGSTVPAVPLEVQAPQVMGALPMSSKACLQILESVFPESEIDIRENSDPMRNGEIFCTDEQVGFFEKVTDFDHASGLTAKWSWTDISAGRNILEFVGIDTKNVIKTDKGYIYVPDFASDLSFTPLKPEKISFPESQLAKKPTYQNKDELTSLQRPLVESRLAPSSGVNESHRALPLSLDVGALSKDSDVKIESALNAKNEISRGKPIDIEEFLSLPTISSILTNPVQKSVSGRVLSEEAKRIIYLIPNISYMTSSHLCFPVVNRNTSQDDKSLI